MTLAMGSRRGSGGAHGGYLRSSEPLGRVTEVRGKALGTNSFRLTSASQNAPQPKTCFWLPAPGHLNPRARLTLQPAPGTLQGEQRAPEGSALTS